MSTNLTWHEHQIVKNDRAARNKQTPCIIWFTGLSGAGKSTLANALEQSLFEQGHHTYVLDGDNIRHGINRDLGFSDEDRVENIRRIGEVAKLFVDAGMIVLSAFISPFERERMTVRNLVEPGEFVEVHVATALDVCESRDPKGLYKKAREGKIKLFTGIDSEYQAPQQAEITIDTENKDVKDCIDELLGYLQKNNYI